MNFKIIAPSNEKAYDAWLEGILRGIKNPYENLKRPSVPHFSLSQDITLKNVILHGSL
jgi:hypothetical protein